MNILEIISKKRDAKELNREEIGYFVKEYTNGNITDYQAPDDQDNLSLRQ